ncbi:ABC transporter substrate-binding protein [Calorimonas adulescens]|uniref:ABC transporter substrate-binding protein n=2 Tax=Calorimonas adulescens TaxID=2606906 RepID=A0A5D8QG79_9THEO|nr:ABC transporter substrate-binding protein [Calorimonas adulescens]
MCMSKRFYLMLTMVLVVTLFVSACGNSQTQNSQPAQQSSSQGTGSKESLKLGMVGPLTGNTATYGTSVKNGVEIAVDEFNNNGGYNGQNVELVAEDSRGDQTEASNATRKLIEQDKVFAIVGAVLSSETLTAAPIANDAGIPMISPSATAPGVPEVGPYIFRNCIADNVQAVQMAEYAAKELGLKRFAVMYTNNDYGLALKNAFTDTAKTLGEVVGVEAYMDGDNDFRAQLSKLKQQNPDALYIGGYYTEAAKIAQQAKQQGLDNVVLLGGDGFYSPQLVELGGDAVEGAVFTAGFFSGDPAEPVQKFVSAYKAKFNAEPDMFAAQAYDAANIVLNALKKAGPDSKAIREEMAATKDFPGITGVTSFDEQGDAVKQVLILKVVDGKFTKLR